MMRIPPEGAAFLAQTVFRLPRPSLRVFLVWIAIGEIVLVEASVVAPVQTAMGVKFQLAIALVIPISIKRRTTTLGDLSAVEFAHTRIAAEVK